MNNVGTIVVFLLGVFVLVALARAVRIVPQARAGIVERFGRFHRVLGPGLTIVVPFFDRVLELIDLREQVVSFPPQPVITQDNLVVSIDTVIYYQVTTPKDATYEIANYIQAIEQLTVTTLRNVIGGLDLERTLTSREDINDALRGVLDDATGKWGIRVNRVELKAIDPPASIQDSMEKQMRADRDKRATILNAEGVRQSQILTAEGQKQAAILSAEGDKQSAILRAEADKQAEILRADGQSKAITAVFQAIHRGKPDQRLLSYQYMQMLPEIAKGDANKVWVVPSEIGRALEGLGGLAGNLSQGFGGSDGAATDATDPVDDEVPAEPGPIDDAAEAARREVSEAVSRAEDEVQQALDEARSAGTLDKQTDELVASLRHTSVDTRTEVVDDPESTNPDGPAISSDPEPAESDATPDDVDSEPAGADAGSDSDPSISDPDPSADAAESATTRPTPLNPSTIGTFAATDGSEERTFGAGTGPIPPPPRPPTD